MRSSWSLHQSSDLTSCRKQKKRRSERMKRRNKQRNRRRKMRKLWSSRERSWSNKNWRRRFLRREGSDTRVKQRELSLRDQTHRLLRTQSWNPLRLEGNLRRWWCIILQIKWSWEHHKARNQRPSSTLPLHLKSLDRGSLRRICCRTERSYTWNQLRRTRCCWHRSSSRRTSSHLLEWRSLKRCQRMKWKMNWWR